MTEDETIEWGMRAEGLVTSNEFNDLFDKIKDDLAREILSTPLCDNDYREQLYVTFNGMRAFADRLVQLVTAKENIKAERDAKNNSEQDID